MVHSPQCASIPVSCSLGACVLARMALAGTTLSEQPPAVSVLAHAFALPLASDLVRLTKRTYSGDMSATSTVSICGQFSRGAPAYTVEGDAHEVGGLPLHRRRRALPISISAPSATRPKMSGVPSVKRMDPWPIVIIGQRDTSGGSAGGQ